MVFRVWLAGFMALVLAGAAYAADEAQWMELKDGVKARLLTALQSTDPDKPKTLIANFVLNDQTVLANHTKIIDVADQLFGRVVLVPADTKGFKRASVNILISETKVGEETVQTFEDFHYARGDNAVWLRQAGSQDWKIAQDPSWKAPTPEIVELPQGTAYVDFFGQIRAPAGATKALGIEMRTATPVTNVPGKYAEVKALWAKLDLEKLKAAGFDFVHIENYSEPLRGRFHVRQRFWLHVRRADGEDWPALPDTAPLNGARDPLVAGLSIDDNATRFAAAAVGSIVRVSAPLAEVEGVAVGIGISLLAAGDYKKGPTAFEYLQNAK